MTISAVAAVLVLAPAVEPRPTCESPPPPAGLRTALAIRALDGSTIQARFGRRVETVRYLGVVTPALAPQRQDARQAWELNRQLVEGRAVRLEFDELERNRAGQLLAYVYVGDAMVNAELVCRGYAEARTATPNVRYEELFRKLEREAREAGRGRWPRVTVRDGLVSVVFNATPASEAVRAIARATGIPMVVPASLERQTLTLDIEALPVEDVLRQVLTAAGAGGMALIYGPRGRIIRVILVDSPRHANRGTPAPAPGRPGSRSTFGQE